MKFSHCIKLTVFALIASLSIPHAYIYTSAPEQENVQQVQTALQQILNQHIDHLNTIDRLLQDLLLLVNGGSSKNPNKQAICQNALEMRDLISSLTGNVPVQVEPSHVQVLGFISQEMMAHLIKALDNHLVDLPAFDVQKIITRGVPALEDLNQLVQAVEHNSKLLNSLNGKVSTAGLRWYNKMYRKFDKLVIQPSLKYNLPTIAAVSAGTGLAAGYLLWHSTSTNSFLRSWFQHPPRMPNGELDLNYHYPTQEYLATNPGAVPHPINWAGDIERSLRLFNIGNMPVGTLAAGALLYYYRNGIASLGTWASNRIAKIHNLLKGGVFVQQYDKADVKHMAAPRTTFKNIIGMDQAKATLMSIVQYLEAPERFDRGGLTPEKGYLLTGPSRSGKTYLADALAGEIKEMYRRNGKNPDDFNYFSLNATFIIQEGIRNLIDRAKQYAPCIIFIDEIDLLGLQRGGNNPMLSEFLTAMSGALEENPDKVVILIGATNKPENLDFALRQRGRFGKEIRFEYPNFNERKMFFESKISKLANVSNFELDKMARETEGKSFEDLNSMIKRGFQRGIQQGKALTQNLLEGALDEEVRNIVDNNAINSMPEHEKMIIAAHQAGQALATIILGHQNLAKVTIKAYLAKLKEENPFDQFYTPDDQQQKKIRYGKTYTYHNHDPKNINGLDQKAAICKELVAGFAAEKIMIGACGYGYEAEQAQQALDLCRSIVSEGVDLKQLPADLQNKYYQKALELKQQYEKEITKVLEHHKPALKSLTDALLQKQELTGAQVHKIIAESMPNVTFGAAQDQSPKQ